MPQFTPQQCIFFNAKNGAGSVVTKREHSDSQITLDTHEKEVVFSKISQHQIPQGSVRSSGTKKISFDTFPVGGSVQLNLNFPKPAKSELRLYIADGGNFKPPAGDYWFIYTSKASGKLTIGFMDQQRWDRSLGNKATSTSVHQPLPSVVDDDDEAFQKALLDYDPTPKITTRNAAPVYGRKPSIAAKALQLSKYKCEVDADHETFLARNGNPYVEAHHLIPISATARLSINLDFTENLISLCPNCHRAIHHAELNYRAELVEQLYEQRRPKLAQRGIHLSLAEVLTFYNV